MPALRDAEALGWRDAATAPRDGSAVLALWDNNDGTYEAVVVWWAGGEDYPWAFWQTDDSRIAESRIAYWRPLPELPCHV